MPQKASKDGGVAGAFAIDLKILLNLIALPFFPR
jgi:hypothetical protein